MSFYRNNRLVGRLLKGREEYEACCPIVRSAAGPQPQQRSLPKRLQNHIALQHHSLALGSEHCCDWGPVARRLIWANAHEMRPD